MGIVSRWASFLFKSLDWASFEDGLLFFLRPLDKPLFRDGLLFFLRPLDGPLFEKDLFSRRASFRDGLLLRLFSQTQEVGFSLDEYCEY